MAAFNYTLFLISFMIFPMFMPRTVSAIRIQQQLTPSKSPNEGANSNMLAVHNVPPHESHENGFRVLMKGRRVTPSGPSHRGNTAPIFTRHLLRKVDTISFQELSSVPGPGVGHR
ncbi:hypothetical protein CRYUN_Cryun32bG0053300 [Craigia yunnanensis]